ncbi:MAG: hypothetical protein JRJ50_15370 [Deltaproteobacteria bacterium]|nr:hypothetical protein [Deltaproteobacteria bacterium]
MEEIGPVHWAWIILATCFVNLFINYSVRLGYGVVLPEMIRDLGLSRTAGGSIFNAYLFSYIVPDRSAWGPPDYCNLLLDPRPWGYPDGNG